jgi:hypothetical protein
MGWLYMIASAAAAALFFNQEPLIAFYIALVVLGVSFASFCLLYDEPVKRAAFRIAQRMSQISARGLHGEEFQRLQAMTAVVTAEDKKFRLTILSAINVASGVAGMGLLVWALILWIA